MHAIDLEQTLNRHMKVYKQGKKLERILDLLKDNEQVNIRVCINQNHRYLIGITPNWNHTDIFATVWKESQEKGYVANTSGVKMRFAEAVELYSPAILSGYIYLSNEELSDYLANPNKENYL